MVFLMIMGIPIPYTLGISSLIAGIVTFGGGFLDKVGWTSFQFLYGMNWIPLPLFIVMASIIAVTSIGEGLFDAASKWLSRVPGSLVVASVLGEAALASIIATSGSCIATVGKVAEPQFLKHNYDRGLAFGALLCGGVLGPLIPPSTGFIIYGIFAEQSIGRLFIAGIIPGIILATLLASVAIFVCWRNPKLGPSLGPVSWRERFKSLKGIWPIVVLMLSVLGAIYFGITTPTEAAGFGVVVTFILGIALFGLRWAGIKNAIVESALINGMILFIIISAQIFTYVISSSGLGMRLAEWVVSLNISTIGVILIIMILYLILGCFMDGITIMMVTLPVFIPMLKAMNIDMIWFGVMFVINMQIGLITPPFGVDLYLTQNMFHIPLPDLLRGTTPFLIMLVFFLGVIIAFPQLSLWLPNTMMGK
jgi:C4-dicarboxylate transporter, DctM subunit